MSDQRKFTDLSLHADAGCTSVSIVRDVEGGEVWEARYCYDHKLKYKAQVVSGDELGPALLSLIRALRRKDSDQDGSWGHKGFYETLRELEDQLSGGKS